MEEKPYSREELLAATSEFPQRGLFCPHCEKFIPQFADFSEQDERRIRELIRNGRTLTAMSELSAATGCPISWAKLWVLHKGRQQITKWQTIPCPYCGKPLRTPLAKQCRFCLRDWHDPHNVTLLSDK